VLSTLSRSVAYVSTRKSYRMLACPYAV